MSNEMTRAMQKELNSRVKALPGDYQVVFHEISKYLYQFASSDAGVVGMQFDILDMFETGAQDGKDVLDIVGNDVIGFCDGILGSSPEDTWMGKMKAVLNQSIHKKLAKRKSSGKCAL
jgi:DNA-binding ferritin-like protein (Dps family)